MAALSEDCALSEAEMGMPWQSFMDTVDCAKKVATNPETRALLTMLLYTLPHEIEPLLERIREWDESVLPQMACRIRFSDTRQVLRGLIVSRAATNGCSCGGHGCLRRVATLIPQLSIWENGTDAECRFLLEMS